MFIFHIKRVLSCCCKNTYLVSVRFFFFNGRTYIQFNSNKISYKKYWFETKIHLICAKTGEMYALKQLSLRGNLLYLKNDRLSSNIIVKHLLGICSVGACIISLLNFSQILRNGCVI